MTHDEMITVIAAHRDKKALQVKGSTHGKWEDYLPSKFSLLDVLSDIAGGDTFRVKPEPRQGFVPDTFVYDTRELAQQFFPQAEIIKFVEVVR